MTTVPPRLRMWREALEEVKPELALALAPWLQRLHLAVGPQEDARAHVLSGSPDGYDGVGARGPYERLLVSEWLLADELPEEFFRRAIFNEHLFHQLRPRDPRPLRRCVVLFDAGPAQLGTPRLAHLALLIVFARRAREAGSTLVWATLQSAPGAAREGFGREQGAGLLAGRSARDAGDEDLDGWLAALSCAKDEVWVITGLRGLDRRGLNRITVEDDLGVDARRLTVSVRASGRPAAQVALELPPAQVCTGLIRDPFAPPKAPRVRAQGPYRPARGLLFSPVGERLFSLTDAGSLAIIPLPSPVGGRVRISVFAPPTGERVVGAGWKKGPVAVTVRSDPQGTPSHVVLYPLSRRGDRKATPEVFVLGPAPPVHFAGLSPLVVIRGPSQVSRHLACASGLITLAAGRAEVQPMRVVSHAAGEDVGWILSLDSAGRRLLTRLSIGAPTSTVLEEFAGDAAGAGDRPVVLGWGRAGTPACVTPNAVDATLWTVHGASAPLTVPVPRQARVVTPLVGWNPPGLLAVSGDGTELAHHSSGGRTDRLVVTPSPMVAIAADVTLPRVAWVDGDGGVSVLALWPGNRRLLVGAPVEGLARLDFRVHHSR